MSRFTFADAFAGLRRVRRSEASTDVSDCNYNGDDISQERDGTTTDNTNRLKFYPYAHSGLTRSVGTLNLSLAPSRPSSAHDDVVVEDTIMEEDPINSSVIMEESQHDGVADCMDRWTPFKDEQQSGGNVINMPPETPTLKRSISKSELSPFVNNPDTLKKWREGSTSWTPSTSLQRSWKPKSLNQTSVLVSDPTDDSSNIDSVKLDTSIFSPNGLRPKTIDRESMYPERWVTPNTPVKKSPLGENQRLSNWTQILPSIMDDENQSPSISITSSNDQGDQVEGSRVPLRSQNVNILNYQGTTLTDSPTPRMKLLNDNKYKKYKKTRHSVIMKDKELTQSLQQFKDELYGTDENYTKPPGSQNMKNLTPTRTNFESIDNDLMSSTDSSPLVARNHKTISKTTRQINATVISNPDSHLYEKFMNVQRIGGGQFATVYQVTLTNGDPNNRYAVKSMTPNKRNSLRHIMQEIQILAEITEKKSHDKGKYVMDYLGSWLHQGYVYIMTPYYENGNLNDFLQERLKNQKGRLEDWRIWKILVEVSLGLRFIHQSCQIVHLDLKPANILITFEGNLKIADFGMATHLPLPKDGFFENEGDREYIAPEIISESTYDYKSDIFSLGLIIVEIAANVILPDNGTAWHKLRSGDLSDAGRLSSTELNHSASVFSDTTTHVNGSNDCLANENGGKGVVGGGKPREVKGVVQGERIPAWVPKFLIDGGESLGKTVKWMIEPNYRRRPSAEELLFTEECLYVESHRKAGATIHEDDFGPAPEFYVEQYT